MHSASSVLLMDIYGSAMLSALNYMQTQYPLQPEPPGALQEIHTSTGDSILYSVLMESSVYMVRMVSKALSKDVH